MEAAQVNVHRVLCKIMVYIYDFWVYDGGSRENSHFELCV